MKLNTRNFICCALSESKVEFITYDKAGNRLVRKAETNLGDFCSVALRLLTAEEWTTRVTLPTEAIADVTLRRLQSCRFALGTKAAWEYGEASGTVTADENGLVTIPGLKITAEPTVLKIKA